VLVAWSLPVTLSAFFSERNSEPRAGFESSIFFGYKDRFGSFSTRATLRGRFVSKKVQS